MISHIFLDGAVRRLVCGVLVCACLVLGVHYALEYCHILATGVAGNMVTLDFKTYMCGAGDMSAPYDHCHLPEAVSGFVYPPPSLIYFHGLSLLPLNTAFVLHTLVSLACLALASAMLMDLVTAGREARLGGLCAALGIAPIGTSLLGGQVNIIVMACCVAAVWCLHRRRGICGGGAGLAVALGFWLKLYPAVLPVLFLRDHRRAIVWTIVATLALALVSLLWASPRLYGQYFGELLPVVQRYTMPGVAYSLAGIAAHIAMGGGAPVSHFQLVPPAILLASRIVLVAGIALALLHQWRAQGQQPAASLSILLIATLIAAPNAWGYHYALAYPAVFCAMARGLERPSAWLAVVVGCWAALAIPGWTDPPHAIAATAWLNVPFRGRYALAVLALGAFLFADARPRGRKPA